MARLIEALSNVPETWARVQTARAGGRLPHALAVCGAGGGPAQFAWALAQALVCEAADAPCGVCGPCLRVEKQQSESVLLIEPDKGTIKLEAAESISRFLSLQKLTKVRVILVNEAHTLNPQATNAILKLVEEPPPDTHFIFVAVEAGQLLPTLRSRVQVLRLPLARPDGSEEPLRAPVEEFLKRCLKRDSGAVHDLLEKVEGREETAHAALVMQQVLRDWSCIQPGILDSGFGIQNTEFGIRNSVEIWRFARQAEIDLQSNVDRNLVFENFYRAVGYAVD